MSGIQKLHLEDAFDDTPQIRSYADLFEKDAKLLEVFATGMKAKCDKLTNILSMLSECTREISNHMKSYKEQKFYITDDETVLIDSIDQVTKYLDKHSEKQYQMSEDLNCGMMFSIDKFISTDLCEVFRLGNIYKMVGNERDQSLCRYMKLSTRKDSSKTFKESEQDLFSMKRKYHQSTLQYFSSLNCLQYHRKISLLQPLLVYLKYSESLWSTTGSATSNHTPSATNDSDSDNALTSFLCNAEEGIEGVQLELNTLTMKQKEDAQILEQSTDYRIDHQDNDCRTHLTQNSGYLFMRSKQTLITSKWERAYFFVQSGNLMCQHKNEIAGSLLIDLTTSDSVVSSCVVDDRVHCFKISSVKAKKTLILQAESKKEEAEWISTLSNVISETSGPVNGNSCSSSVRSLTQGASISSEDKPHQKLSPHKNTPPPPIHSNKGVVFPGTSDFTITNAPIQFDITSPKEDTYSSIDFTQRRVNPFDENPPDMIMTSSICSSGSNAGENSTFLRSFIVRFIGSMQVDQDRGDQLIYETMRQIMVTRAMHNIFKTSESRLLISSESMRIIDQSNNSIRRGFMLQNISYWTSHNENKRLFGFITCNRSSDDNEQTFTCHVFECDTSADEICHSISTATKLAYEIMINESNKSENSKENENSNLNLQPGDDDLSCDSNHPMREVQGDERRIEGAESDS